MMKLKLEKLFFISNIFSLILVSVIIFSSCKKRIKEVHVKVFNVSTNEGIKGVNVYYGDEKYTTNHSGEIILSASRNMEGDFVTTNLSIANYTNADYPNTCKLKNEYEIISENLSIPLLRIKKLKLSIKNSSSNSGGIEKVCIKFDDNQNCRGEFFDAFEVRNNEIINHPWIDNGSVYFGMSIIEGTALMKVYSNYDCESDNNPDTIYGIPVQADSDTVAFTLLL